MSSYSFLDYHGLQTFKGKLDEVFDEHERAYTKLETLAVSTSMTGSGGTVTVTITNANIESDMVVVGHKFSNPAAQTDDLSWSTDTPGTCTLTGKINGTTTVTLYLSKTR